MTKDNSRNEVFGWGQFWDCILGFRHLQAIAFRIKENSKENVRLIN